jgi:hypothetical protein
MSSAILNIYLNKIIYSLIFIDNSINSVKKPRINNNISGEGLLSCGDEDRFSEIRYFHCILFIISWLCYLNIDIFKLDKANHQIEVIEPLFICNNQIVISRIC